jgi:hypothetical protein
MLKRHLTFKPIERDRLEMHARRVAFLEDGHLQCRRLERVVIDDEVEGRPADLPGEAGEGEVLRPHAGVTEFGLMTGEDERAVGDLQLAPRQCPQFAERHSAHDHVGVIEEAAIRPTWARP